MQSRIPRLLSLMVVFALLLTACSGAEAVDDPTPTSAERRSQTGTYRGRLVRPGEIQIGLSPLVKGHF